MCGVQAHGGVAIPATGLAGPTLGMAGLGGSVDLVSVVEEAFVLTSMALRGSDEGDAAVTMLLVVPSYEPGDPGRGVLEAFEGLVGEARVSLDGAEDGLGKGVVVADPRSREGAADAEGLQRCDHRRPFHRAPVGARLVPHPRKKDMWNDPGVT